MSIEYVDYFEKDDVVEPEEIVEESSNAQLILIVISVLIVAAILGFVIYILKVRNKNRI